MPSDFIRQLIDNRESVERFCSRFHVNLLEIYITTENISPEPAYIFSDGLGYYTRKGIEASLVE